MTARDDRLLELAKSLADSGAIDWERALNEADAFEPVRIGAGFPVGDAWHLQVRFTTTYFVDGFTAADFGSTGDFEARGELVPSILGSVVFDVPNLFR